MSLPVWRRSIKHARNRLEPSREVIASGFKILGPNGVLCAFWLLFPLFLILSSDWIGVLVVFQAMTAALHLRNAPAAKILSVSSSNSVPSGAIKGEYRVQ